MCLRHLLEPFVSFLGTMDGPTYMRYLSSEWEKVEEIDRVVFREEAKKIRQDPYKGKPRDPVTVENN